MKSTPTGSASGSSISNNRGARWTGTFAEYPPAMQRLLRFAGLDPEHALVRWGNFDRTVLLPSTVFEAEQSGRSYQFRPNVRSIWVRNFPVKGPVKAYFQVPDTPGDRRARQGNGRRDRERIDPDDQLMGPAGTRARSHGTLARDRAGRLLHARSVRRR